MKKILFLVPRMNIGGAETYVYTVAVELQKRGYDIYLASGGGQLADQLEELGIKTFFLPIRHFWTLSAWLLKWIIKKYNIELIHANSGAAGIVAAKVKRMTEIPVVYTAHGVFGNPEREHVIDELDKIICVSEYVRQHAIGIGFKPNHLEVCYNGIDVNRFQPNEEVRQQLRQSLGLKDDTLVLAIVSRIKNLRSKGHQILLNILANQAKHDNWKLLIIGKGVGTIKLQKEILAKGLKDKVIYLGHKTDVHKWLNAADLMVLPSRFETFGIVLAEAMSMGKPAVAFAVGGTPEVIKENETGFLTEKNNEQELYNKIKMLDNDRKLLKQFSTNGMQWVRQNFTNTQMVDILEKIYNSL